MKKDIYLIMKGFLIGIAKVIPGVSGSLLAISLGVYEQAVEAISHFFTSFKEHILFLGKLGIGILIAIILCSKLVLYLLTNFYVPTMFLFIGLISGGIPSIFSKFSFKSTRNKIIIIMIFLIFLIMSNYINLEKYTFENTVADYIYLFIIGFLDAFTMVAPGISGTLIFLMLGVYEFVMYVFGNVFEILFTTPLIIFMVGTGILSGIYLTSLFMNTLFKKHTDLAYTIITALMISSTYLLFSKSIMSITNIFSLLEAIICILIGFYFSRKIE